MVFILANKKILWSDIVTNFVKKLDPLFFIKEKKRNNSLKDEAENVDWNQWGEKKIRYLDASKCFFGTVLQLLFQFWVLRVSIYYKEARFSQYLSVFSSTFFTRDGFK